MLGLNWAFLLQLGACSSSFSVPFLLHASAVFMAVGEASQDLPYISVLPSSWLLVTSLLLPTIWTWHCQLFSCTHSALVSSPLVAPPSKQGCPS